MPKTTRDLGLKASIQTFYAFVRCTLMGNQPWPQFQNGIRERPIKNQNWQGKFLSTVWNYEDLAEQYFACMGWRNIPDYIEASHVQLPRLAQDLYKSRHDGLLVHLQRAILDKNGIPPDNSKFSKPEPCIEKENVKILWDTSLQLLYALSNGANKPDITEIDHEQKLIILYEGTVCAVGKRHQRWSEKTSMQNVEQDY